MRLSLSVIADRLGLLWEGLDAPDLAPALMEEAGPGSVSLATTEKFVATATRKGVSALVVPPGLDCPLPCMRAEMPRIAFAHLLGIFDQRPVPLPGIHPTAVVHPSAFVDPSCILGPHVVIEEGARVGRATRIGPNCCVGTKTRIGENCDLGPNVTIYGGCSIGDRVLIKAGAVVGGDGFGFEWDGTQHMRVPHLGTVVLEDDVEIGSNSCIDRAKTHETRVERGTKIDNLVQVAHGVRVGPGSMLAAQVGIAGSSQIGAGCMFGGQSGVIDNVKIGPGSIFTAASAVMTDIEGGNTYMGIPARDAKIMRRFIVSQPRLPELFGRVRRLELGAESPDT